MQNLLFSIYDRKAQYYLAPFTARSETDALRVFNEAVISSETPVSQYPADFDLLALGAVDLETGVLTPEMPTPRPIINGLVALTNAQRERSRYQAIMNTVREEEPLPEAS